MTFCLTDISQYPNNTSASLLLLFNLFLVNTFWCHDVAFFLLQKFVIDRSPCQLPTLGCVTILEGWSFLIGICHNSSTICKMFYVPFSLFLRLLCLFCIWMSDNLANLGSLHWKVLKGIELFPAVTILMFWVLGAWSCDLANHMTPLFCISSIYQWNELWSGQSSVHYTERCWAEQKLFPAGDNWKLGSGGMELWSGKSHDSIVLQNVHQWNGCDLANCQFIALGGTEQNRQFLGSGACCHHLANHRQILEILFWLYFCHVSGILAHCMACFLWGITWVVGLPHACWFLGYEDVTF